MMPQETGPESINYLLAQVCKLHRARAHALLEGVGLHRGQHHALRALWERDGLTHSQLADHLHVRPATVSKMVQRMVRKRLVECRPDPQDQRVSRIYLTSTGRTVREHVQRVWRQLEAETFKGISPEERELLRRCFLRIRDNLLEVHGGVLPCRGEPGRG